MDHLSSALPNASSTFAIRYNFIEVPLASPILLASIFFEVLSQKDLILEKRTDSSLKLLHTIKRRYACYAKNALRLLEYV